MPTFNICRREVFGVIPSAAILSTYTTKEKVETTAAISVGSVRKTVR